MGIKLTELTTERGVCWRRLRVLIAGLPAGARTWRALDVPSAWTDESHLLAACFDVLALANWQRSGSKSRRPKALPRPGVEDRTGVTKLGRRTRSVAETRALLARMAGREV